MQCIYIRSNSRHSLAFSYHFTFYQKHVSRILANINSIVKNFSEHRSFKSYKPIMFKPFSIKEKDLA
jgi:hypothetical protein